MKRRINLLPPVHTTLGTHLIDSQHQNSKKTIVNQPYFGSLHHPFIVNLGVVHRFTNIVTFQSVHLYSHVGYVLWVIHQNDPCNFSWEIGGSEKWCLAYQVLAIF